ncbi:hypothetical protein [Streptomyces sp. NPDC021608]|uniref:hypothetical protein n=1 Tax=Streptomyces sp. NPDC021608 TaxID=3154903 RepID=UPI0034053B50
MTQADDHGTTGGTPELIRIEDPWPPDEPRLAVQLRVWRLAPGRLAVVFADDIMADDRLTPLIRRIVADYPEDSIAFSYEEVTTAASQGHYATLALTDDGRLRVTVLDGTASWDLHRALGPTLRDTGRPDDDGLLWGGP